MHPATAALLFGALLLSGCATNLTHEEDGNRLAQAAGVPRENIRLARVCWVMSVRPPEIRGEIEEYHAVVVAQEALHLLELETGWIRERPKHQGIRLKYSDMKGVDLKKDSDDSVQLQILCAENIYVIRDYRPWRTMLSPPIPAYSEQIFRLIRERGVPTGESKAWYFAKKSPVSYFEFSNMPR